MNGAGCALIGHTGFVGSNLKLSKSFEHLFCSSNIDGIGRQDYKLVVCAAPSAEKWRANLDPKADFEHVSRLIESLRKVRAERFVLLSTIDVYARKSGIWDDCEEYELSQAYGKNRRILEDFVQNEFSCSNVIRLPGLFGVGLKKNVIFDLIHKNQLDRINPESSFQFYSLRRLGDDIERILELDIASILLATEPLKVKHIVDSFFPGEKVGGSESAAVSYDIKTRSYEMLGGENGYIQSSEQVMEELARFINGCSYAA